ncbi:unnamed protein product [Cladocopium goreaui]|uniref:Metalloendopeptidase n=1 Tax=Cladocopium goreaui TaxID=2562237 RepID=A0A9P1DBJ1_9DINO|nr:unnamed protein product [Cladocopium goreaui]
MGKVRQELPGIEFINVGYKGPDACNTHPAIYIQSSNTGCWADIGMSIEDFTGNQKLNLGVPGCTDCGTAIHELLHSMGMAHEQSRPDRDTFVEIKWDNIMSSMYSQFAKDPHADTSVDYDIMSIMHDGRFHWSNNGKETIVVKEAGYRLYTDDPGQHHRYAIGQHIMMTQNDVRQLAKMYNCTSNTICGTGRTDVRNVNNGAPSASIKGQTDIFHGYQSVSYVTAAAFSLVASSLACCCFCSFSISQSKNEDSRSLLREP